VKEPARAEEAETKPEWADGAPPPTAKQPRRNTALGTNNAPIFE
jgi:hypothetical protein